VDLGLEVGADSVYFSRITNWGTFTETEYARKAVFMPTHPEYSQFVRVMRDPRLLHPIVILGDLSPFVGAVAPTGDDLDDPGRDNLERAHSTLSKEGSFVIIA
jgi:hypothetical protein